MNLLTIAQAAKPGLGARRLRALCLRGRIPGAQRLGGVWLLPSGFSITPGRPAGNPNWVGKVASHDIARYRRDVRQQLEIAAGAIEVFFEALDNEAQKCAR